MYSSTLPSALLLGGGGLSNPRPGRFTSRGKTRYPLYRRLGGPQGRSARVRRISSPTEIRSPNLPARSESLYRLSYPGPFLQYPSKHQRTEQISFMLVFRLQPLKQPRTALFWVVTQRVVVISYRRFGKKLSVLILRVKEAFFF